MSDKPAMSLGDRMKRYEDQYRVYLKKKTAVIIRLDGKAFHSFSRGMVRPFDDVLMSSMQETMLYLCSHIQNCVFGYTQSDEITLVLLDDKNEKTDPWFGNNLQKIASVSASMATMQFNKVFERKASLVGYDCATDIEIYGSCDQETDKLAKVYAKAADKGALFDSRAFQLPKFEIVNNLIWRQQDAIRNSIQMVGFSQFGTAEMYKKNTRDVREMLLEKGIDWENFTTSQKRGTCCYKVESQEVIPDRTSPNPDDTITVTRKKWVIDNETPEFVTNKKFIEDIINSGEKNDLS